MMKRIFVLLVLLMFTCLVGCSFFETQPFKLRQETNQIASIEIVKRDYNYDKHIFQSMDMEVLLTVDATEYDDVINTILSMDGGWSNPPPSYDFGLYLIRITYLDGGVELLGNYNCGYISADGTVDHVQYIFSSEPYYAYISQLLGQTVRDDTYG